MLSVTYLSMSRKANSNDAIVGIVRGTKDTPTFFNTIMVYHRPPPALMRRKLRREYSEREFSLQDIEACTMVVRVTTAVRWVPLMVFGLKHEPALGDSAQRLTVTKIAMARFNSLRRSRVFARGLLDVCADRMGIDACTIEVPTASCGDSDLASVLADEYGFAKGSSRGMHTRTYTASSVSTPDSTVTAPLDTSTPAGSDVD